MASLREKRAVAFTRAMLTVIQRRKSSGEPLLVGTAALVLKQEHRRWCLEQGVRHAPRSEKQPTAYRPASTQRGCPGRLMKSAVYCLNNSGLLGLRRRWSTSPCR